MRLSGRACGTDNGCAGALRSHTVRYYDTIAALTLGLVECGIGGLKQFLLGEAMIRKSSHSKRCGDLAEGAPALQD